MTAEDTEFVTQAYFRDDVRETNLDYDFWFVLGSNKLWGLCETQGNTVCRGKFIFLWDRFEEEKKHCKTLEN